MALTLIVSALLCGVLLGPHVQAQPERICKSCPPGWTVFEGRCYSFHKKELEWFDAERACTSHGANLASLPNPRVLQFIRNLIFTTTGSNIETWVGGNDAIKEGKWLWSDGSHFAFKDWAKGEPNNRGHENCMEINYRGSGVNDEGCTDKNSYICAKDMI